MLQSLSYQNNNQKEGILISRIPFVQNFLSFLLQNSRETKRDPSFSIVFKKVTLERGEATSIISKFMKYLNFELYYSKTQH